MLNKFEQLSRSEKTQFFTQISRMTRDLANLHIDWANARTQAEKDAIDLEIQEKNIEALELTHEYGIEYPPEYDDSESE